MDNQIKRINQKSEVDEVKKFISNVLANWYWVALSLIIAVVIAFLINRYTIPTYSVYTTILSKKYYKSRSSRTMDVIQGSEYFATQKDINWEVSVLKSYRIVTETIRRLNWDVFYYEQGNIRTTELYPGSPLKVMTDTSSTNVPYGVMIDCEVVSDNSFELRTEHEQWKSQIPEKAFTFDEVHDISGWKFRLSKEKYLTAGRVIGFKINRIESLVGQYRGKLGVGWLAKGSAVLKLTLVGETPRREMDFLTKMAEVIDEQSIITKNEAIAVTDALAAKRLILPSGADADSEEQHADPHVWNDVSMWSQCVKLVSDELSKLRPEHAEAFAGRAANYQEQMQQLHEYGMKICESIPEQSRLLVTSHDAFSYFGRAYGIEVQGIQGISTESEAGLQRINRLVDLLIDRQVKAVFIESSVSPKNIEALIEGVSSRGQQVKLGGVLFSDAMGKQGTYEGTYIGMLDHNLTTAARALGGEAPELGFQGKLSGTADE